MVLVLGPAALDQGGVNPLCLDHLFELVKAQVEGVVLGGEHPGGDEPHDLLQ